MTDKTKMPTAYEQFISVKTDYLSLRRKAALSAFVAVFLFVLPLTGVFLYTRGRASAAASSTLNFQARLLSNTGNTVADGSYNIQFNLYTVPTAGTTQWTESRLVSATQGVTVKNGFFSVNLGSITSFPSSIAWDQEQWLGITVRGTDTCAFGACTPTDAEMTPRFKLTSVPYAFRAAKLMDSTNTNAFTADDLIQKAPATPQVIASALAAIRLNQTSTGGLLQLQNTGVDKFTVDNSGNTTTSGTLAIAGGSATLGSVSQAGSLVLSDGSSNTSTLQAGSTASNLTFTLPTSSGTIGDCLTTTGGGVLEFGSCSGTVAALQNGYNADVDGSDSRIDLTTADDSLIFSNPSVAGTDSTFVVKIEQLNSGAKDALIVTNSGSGNILNLQTAGITRGAFDANANLIAANSATATTGTTSGTGGSTTTTITLAAIGGFANNDVVLVDNTGGSGQDYYARIVSGGGTTTLTVSPAVSYGTAAGFTGNATITKYTSQNIGATTSDYTTQANRFFQGYFLGGITVGANSTTLSDGLLSRTVGDIVVRPGTGGSVQVNGTLNATTITGDGSAITNINGANISAGSVPDASLSANVALLSTTQTFSGSKTFSGQIVGTAGLSLSGTSTINTTGIATTGIGNGTGTLTLTGSSASTFVLGGITIDATEIGYLDGKNANLVDINDAVTTAITGTGALTVGSIGGSFGSINIGTNVFTGNGSGLTTLSGTSISSGTVADARLSTNVALLSANNTFSGTLDVSSTFTAVGQANLNGNTAIGNATTDRLTITSQLLGANALTFQGVTDNLFTTTFTVVDPTGLNVINIPDASGTLVISASGNLALSAAGNVTTNNAVSFSTSVTTPILTSSGALTLSSGGVAALTLDSASNTIVIAATDTALQRVAAGSFTIDLSDGANTTFVVTNSAAGAASLNISEGDLQTAGTSRLTNGGILQNINGLTILSGGASITGNTTLVNDTAINGNTTIGDAVTDRITINSQILGANALTFQGATDNAFTTSFAITDPTANRTITVPNESGTLTLIGPAAAQVDASTNSSIFINKTGASGNILTLQKNAAGVFTIGNGGAVTIANSSTAALDIQNGSGTKYFTVDTNNGLVQVGSATADGIGVLLLLDTKNTTGDPTGLNGAQYYNSFLNKFRCYQNGVWKDCVSEPTIRSFVDTVADAVVDAQTTNYWDLGAENNNAYANITLSQASGKAIMGIVTLETQSTSNNDVEVTARVERGIGVVPTCNTGTPVGGQPGTFSSNNGGIKTSTTTFVDEPNTTSVVYYVVCSDNSTVGIGANITRLRITLQEVNNSN